MGIWVQAARSFLALLPLLIPFQLLMMRERSFSLPTTSRNFFHCFNTVVAKLCLVGASGGVGAILTN